MRRLLFALVAALVHATAAAQTIDTQHLTAGFASFGVGVGAGDCTTGLKIGSLSTQNDIKTQWPGGSIKHAIVSAVVPTTGTYPVTCDAAVSGAAFTPSAWPSNTSVVFTIGGTPYTAQLPTTFNGSDCWLSGPIARSCRVVVTPVTSGATPHGLLRVLMDVTAVSTGGFVFDVVSENVRDVVGGTAVTYDVVITLDGNVVYSKTGTTQSHWTRWRKTFATTGLTLSTVSARTLAGFYEAHLLWKFSDDIFDSTYPAPTGSPYDINELGGVLPGQPPGDQDYIGVQPAWTAVCQTHKTPSACVFMEKLADLAMSFGVHVKKNDVLLTTADYPSYFFNSLSVPCNDTGACSASGWGPVIATSHQYSLVFATYMRTGARHLLDELHYWGVYPTIATTTADGDRPTALWWRTLGGSPRNQGWSLRANAEAWVATPDGNPLKAHFGGLVQQYLNFTDDVLNEPNRTAPYWMATGTNQGESPCISPAWGSPGAKGCEKPWMQAYWVSAFDFALRNGATGAATRNVIIAQAIERHTGAQGWQRSAVQGANTCYYHQPYQFVNVNFNGAGVIQYLSYADAWQDTLDNLWGSGCPTTGYTVYGDLMLTIGVREGISGALAARNWLRSLPHWSQTGNWKQFMLADSQAGDTPPVDPPAGDPSSRSRRRRPIRP